MKRLIRGLAVFLLMALLAGCGSGGSGPEVKVIDIIMDSVSGGKTTVSATILVDNPSDTKGVVENIEYEIRFGHKGKWIFLGHARQQNLILGALETSELVVATAIDDSRRLNTMLEMMLGAEPSRLRVEGSASLAINSEVFDVSFAGEVDDFYSAEAR